MGDRSYSVVWVVSDTLKAAIALAMMAYGLRILIRRPLHGQKQSRKNVANLRLAWYGVAPTLLCAVTY